MTKRTPFDALFRKEFLNRTSGVDGDVIIGTPRYWMFIVAILALTAVACFSYALFATYTKRQSVKGRLVPQGGIIKIVSRNSGVLGELSVKEGDRVHKGQVLAQVNATTYTASGSVAAAMNAAAAAELVSSEASRSAAIAQLKLEKSNLENQLEYIKRTISLNAEVKQNLESRANLANSEISRMEILNARGYISATNLETKRAELIAARQAIIQNEIAQQASKREINEIISRINLIPDRIKEQEFQKMAEQASLRQKVTQLDAQAAESVIAPTDGVIAAIPAHFGQNVQSNSVIMIMTPGSSVLEAELLVPSRAIGFVSLGQEVSLHFHAFPYQRFGPGRGKIVSVSKTVITQADVQSIGATFDEPSFHVKVALNSQNVHAYGSSYPLQPGMQLDANIIIERRNLFQVLFDPLFAMREKI